MNHKFAVLLIILIGIAGCLYCQPNTNDTLMIEKNRNHSIGFIAGFTTGYGLSYRQYFNRFSIQGTIGPSYNNGGDNAKVSSGLTMFYRLNKSYIYGVNYNLYFSNHYFYKKETNTSYLGPYHSNPVTSVTEISKWNTGLGIDLNMRMNHRFVFDLMVGYAQYNYFDKLTATGELGVYYKF